MAEPFTQITLYDSPWTLADIKDLDDIPTELPPTGLQIEVGLVQIDDFRPISRYISVRNDARHSYYERLIGTHMHSIEWRYFQ